MYACRMETTFEGLLDDSSLDRATPKYEQLRAKIMSEIKAGRLRPGDMLPPEPTMAEQMSVARSTVRQALAELEQAGIVRRIRGKGTFIHDEAHLRARSGLDAFALVLPNAQKGYYPSLLAGFDSAATAVRSQVIVVSTLNDSHRQADGILQLIDKKVAGAAIVPAMSPPTPAYQIRQLQQHQIPVVLCHRGIEGVRAPLLAFNGHDVGRLAGEAMLERGHRHIAFISTWRTDLAQRFEAGLRTAIGRGGGAIDDECVVYVETDDDTNLKEYESRMEEAIDHLIAKSCRPTAIFATFDDVAEHIYLSLVRRNIKVPEEISLVSFGGMMRIGPMQQMLTAVTVDEMQLGKHAAEVLDEMRRGKRRMEVDDRVEIPLALSEGRTSGASRNDARLIVGAALPERYRKAVAFWRRQPNPSGDQCDRQCKTDKNRFRHELLQNDIEPRGKGRGAEQHADGQGENPRKQNISQSSQLKPRAIGGHRAGDAAGKNVRGAHGHAEPVGCADRRHRDYFGRCALRVVEMFLADLFADRDDDALPPDHRPAADRDRDGELHPEGQIFRCLIQQRVIFSKRLQLAGIADLVCMRELGEGLVNQIKIGSQRFAVLRRNIPQALLLGHDPQQVTIGRRQRDECVGR